MYNGWENWKTWQVSLWCDNVEWLHLEQQAFLQRKGESLNAKDVEDFMRAQMPNGTPDMKSAEDYKAVCWGELADAWRKEDDPEDVLTYTVVDSHEDEAKVTIKVYGDGSARLDLPEEARIDSNQLTELGWLLLAIAGKGGNKADPYDAAELLWGFNLTIPEPLQQLLNQE